ncbi:hypothetical protein [Mycobacterium genavense]|uniref:hypothetical protein n=1 Tax=Mycobacterium genavense TaxID=36812 RepID=UPI00046EC11B|nr:hypothetical protein [Mycobacterium genavense]
MRNSLRSIRCAAAGAAGAGAVAGAMLFGGMPAANAAPAPAPATTFQTTGPHGGAPLAPGIFPERPGGGHGWGHGWGHPGWGWGNWWRPWW